LTFSSTILTKEAGGECASAAAKEASAAGLHVTFSPMVDLVRDARWGRVVESTGEDPYLNSRFSEAIVKGFQGDDLKTPGKVASCIKHFAGYGGAVAGRDYNTVELSEHTFREFYLPAYKAGIDAGAAMVMTSFNTINGVPASTNKWLIKSGSLRQRRRENGLHAVNDIHHEQHRDVMRLFCHVVILQFFHRIGTGCTENGTGHLQVLFSDSHVICRSKSAAKKRAAA